MADLIAFQERFKAAASDEERKRIKAEMTPDQVAQFDKERAQRRSKKRKISETKSVTIKSEVEDLLISCPLCTKPLVKADREYMATHLNKCSELELIRLMKESDTSKPFPFNQGPSYMNHSAHTEASAAQSGAKKDLEAVDSYSTRLWNSPSLFSHVVGLNAHQFTEILEEFSVKLRRNNVGAPSKLQASQQLTLVLIYLRQYPTEFFLASIFDVSQSTVSRVLAEGLTILATIMDKHLTWPSFSLRLSDTVTIRGECITIVLDGVEQSIFAPVLKILDQIFFSGKKHRHTITKLFGVSPSGRVLHIGPSLPGSSSDMQQYYNEKNMVHQKLQKNEAICADAGFIGLQEHHKLVVPFEASTIEKFPPPTQTDLKQFNKEVAKHRTVVENVFAHIKGWKICDQRLRVAGLLADPDKLLEWHDKIWRICAGFVNRYEQPIRQKEE